MPLVELLSTLVSFNVIQFVDLQAVIFNRVDLQKAILIDAPFAGLDFEGAKLDGAYFTDADLEEAIFTGASFKGAKMLRAQLVGAVLTDADLTGAYLQDADLRHANLQGANFANADLTNAYVTAGQLNSVESLKGTIMPDGKIFEPKLRLEEQINLADNEDIEDA